MLKSIFLLLLSSTLILVSCSSEKCDPSTNRLNDTIYFQLIDNRTGQNLLATTTIYQPRYSLDTVMVYDQNRQPQFPRPVDFSGEIAFPLASNGLRSLPINTQLQHRYILYLNSMDQDTIDINFKLYENNCDFFELSTITVRYNNQLVLESSGTDISPLIFRKK